ncbi:hypothetical protein [Photobacterium indicum]|uniref:hypothetical protein n=1 Tax=Photobacterium indicum TaxID=81447 RepID=UPI001473FB6C|nr:hypothetical protein [Photobacterium indicum]
MPFHKAKKLLGYHVQKAVQAVHPTNNNELQVIIFGCDIIFDLVRLFGVLWLEWCTSIKRRIAKERNNMDECRYWWQ